MVMTFMRNKNKAIPILSSTNLVKQTRRREWWRWKKKWLLQLSSVFLPQLLWIQWDFIRNVILLYVVALSLSLSSSLSLSFFLSPQWFFFHLSLQWKYQWGENDKWFSTLLYFHQKETKIEIQLQLSKNKESFCRTIFIHRCLNFSLSKLRQFCCSNSDTRKLRYAIDIQRK